MIFSIELKTQSNHLLLFNDTIDDGVATSGTGVSYKYIVNASFGLKDGMRYFRFYSNKKFEIFLSFSTTAKGDEN